MSHRSAEEILFGLAALALAGISPNLFPVAQAGYAKMSVTVPFVLLPSLMLLGGLLLLSGLRGHHELKKRILIGAASGLLATVALEAIRTVSFRLGGMPGDLPRLLGVLITDRFMAGPSTGSDVVGYLYHFWNGAAFGILYAVLFFGRPLRFGVGYGLLVGLGFLASPAVKAMGVGFMASKMPAMQATVMLAHAAYGAALWMLIRRLGQAGGVTPRASAARSMRSSRPAISSTAGSSTSESRGSTAP